MTIRPLLSATALLTALLPLAAQAQTAAPAPASGAVTLRYKFTPGEVLRYKMTMDMATAMSGLPGTTPPPTTPMKTHMEMVYRQTVMDVRASDGAATLAGKYESLSTTMNGSPMPGNPMLNAMKGSFTTVMSPTGKMLSFKVGDRATSPGVPGMSMPKMGENMPSYLPDGPVKVGDTWDTVVDLSRMMAAGSAPGMQVAFHSTLTGLDASGGTTVASISQTQQAKMDFKSPASSPTAFSMTGDVAGTGTTRFDVDAGAIASMDMTMTTHSTSTLAKATGGGSVGGGPFTMTMHMTTHMERLPGQDGAYSSF